jgi:hypothetical protein
LNEVWGALEEDALLGIIGISKRLDRSFTFSPAPNAWALQKTRHYCPELKQLARRISVNVIEFFLEFQK